MACNRPLPAWLTKSPNENGKHPVTFRFNEADTSRGTEIPCGRCMGCRLEKARAWATRMVHEAKLHKHNHFLTLTYSDEHLPRSGTGLPTLRPEDFVLFMKRLRKAKGPGVRFYQCGEYGETTARPHHHAILFNCQFTDLSQLRLTRARDAHTLYRSTELEDLWQQGACTVGAVSFETAAYVAAYVTKKITGEKAAEHYRDRIPEYATMSRRPGIAREFLDKYVNEIYPADTIIVRGHEMRPPKYYDRVLEVNDPNTYAEVRFNRETNKQPRTHREREAKEYETTQQLRKRDAQ